MNTLNDIATASDIDQLVEHFYQQVLSDNIIGFFFTDIAKINLTTHLPKISQFWQRQLLGKGDYYGNTFAAHLELHNRAALTHHHFHRWLYLFNQSIDALFTGPRAEQAKKRASGIAQSMLTALQDRHKSERMLNKEQTGLFFFDPNEPEETTNPN